MFRQQVANIKYLTNSTEKSWEAKTFSVSQEIPRILLNPKVHYCIQKRSPIGPIFSQINPVDVTIPLPEEQFYIYPPL